MDWDFEGFWVCPTIGSSTNVCPIKQQWDPGVFPPFSDTVSKLAIISPAMLSSCRVSAAFGFSWPAVVSWCAIFLRVSYPKFCLGSYNLPGIQGSACFCEHFPQAAEVYGCVFFFRKSNNSRKISGAWMNPLTDRIGYYISFITYTRM